MTDLSEHDEGETRTAVAGRLNTFVMCIRMTPSLFLQGITFRLIKRLCIKDPAMAYVYELYMARQREKAKLPEHLLRAAESFTDSLFDIDDPGDF